MPKTPIARKKIKEMKEGDLQSSGEIARNAAMQNGDHSNSSHYQPLSRQNEISEKDDATHSPSGNLNELVSRKKSTKSVSVFLVCNFCNKSFGSKYKIRKRRRFVHQKESLIKCKKERCIRLLRETVI